MSRDPSPRDAAKSRGSMSTVNDFALVRSNRTLSKFLDNCDVLFSDNVTKTNQYGRRQHRVVVVSQTMIYNFKRNHYARPQRQFPLERIEAVFLSEESPMSMIIRIIDEKHVLKLETYKRAPFVLALQEAYMQKTQRKLKVVEMTQALFDKAISEGVSTRMLEKQTVMLRTGSFDEDDFDSDVLVPKGSPMRSSRPVSSLILGSGSGSSSAGASAPAPSSPVVTKKAPPPKPKRRSIVDTVLRRNSQTGKNAYRPVCPPCPIKVGVVQPIWSLVERALEPLNEEDKPPPGLVRCADILIKCVGTEGPKSTEDAMKAVAALCFDKDAARALLKSLSDNVPILGGSALVDSLDALQRCEDATVRRWAIKSLWKLLPMCMAENALPTTSNKWMAALNGSSAQAQQVNQGEESFLAVYFGRGAIGNGSYEQEPLRRIMKRRGSFNLLGGGFKSNTDFPQGLTPALVQQGFAHVLLQNLFDLQRRAGYSIVAAASDPGNKADNQLVQGLVESDCVTLLELLLNSPIKPQDAERRIDVIGKRIRNPALMPTLMGMLVLMQDDSVRQSVVKDVSLLLLRSETNLKAVLDIPNWQLLFIPLLQTVPRLEALRTAEQRILHKYVLNLLTMIHTYCFKEPACKGGPLNVMLGQTFHSLAIYGDWTADTIGVARWILFGLVAQLGLTARSWWHDDSAPEWMALSQLLKCIEIFVFFLPEQGRISTPSTPSLSDRVTPAASPAASPAPTVGKSVVADRAMRRAGADNVRASKDSMSEDDSDSDDEGPRSLKTRKRKFSVTPVYELKGFDPVVRPLAPADAHAVIETYSWIPQRMANGLEKLGADSRIGLHLSSETGRSLDIKLVESVLELLKRMGLTGMPAEDDRRREALKSASKRAKGLLKTASEWLTTMMHIRDLLDELDVACDSNNPSAVQTTLGRVNHFFQTRYGTAKAGSTKLAAIQAKAVATKLEASVLRQRQLAKQHLESHKVVQPVKVARPVIVAADPVNSNVGGGSARRSDLTKTASSRGGGKDVKDTHRSSIVARTRFYSSVGTDGEDSSAPPLPQMPPLSENIEVMDTMEDNVPDGPPCDACGLPCSDDFDAVEKFGATFHADCFTCDECKLPLLKSENPDENNLFFNDGELKKFCGPECRGTMLSRAGRDICPGCMTMFRKGEKAVEACGKLWHVAHLRCNDCHCTLGTGAKAEFFPVSFAEGELWPLCTDCHAKRFRTCAKCHQPIEAKDEAVDALGRVYHAGHFNCVRCGETLTGSDFYVDGHGEGARALCDSCWNGALSPRIVCDGCGEVLADSDDAVELAGHIYHSSLRKKCFCCATCKTPLVPGKVFEVAEMPSCDACFFAGKGHECVACHQLIKTEVLEAEGGTYHPECFQCPKCPPGLVMAGRYMMTESKTPMCETHWIQAFASQCQGCGLALEARERIQVANKQFHKLCLVCAHCHVPLVRGDGKTAALNVGPDERYYCDKHAQGMCAAKGCTQPAFEDGGPLRRIADKYYCQSHFDFMSQQWMVDRCYRCFGPIREGDGLQANGNWYHRSKGCFVCFVCDEPFADGEVYSVLHGVVDGEPVHKKCL